MLANRIQKYIFKKDYIPRLNEVYHRNARFGLTSQNK